MHNEKLLKEVCKYLNSYAYIDLTSSPKKVENECKQNCDLCFIQTEGHGWLSFTCLVARSDAPLGESCPYSKREKNTARNQFDFLL